MRPLGDFIQGGKRHNFAASRPAQAGYAGQMTKTPVLEWVYVASCGQDLYQARFAEPLDCSAGLAEGPWETFERAALARIDSNASSWVSWLVCVVLAGERCQR